MSHGKAWRVGGFIAALGASAGLIASATGATGAYFNDAKSGTIKGTIGSIRVTTSGGSDGYGSDGGLDFNFENMLPGGSFSDSTATVHYANSGSNAEDVYVVFPNATGASDCGQQPRLATAKAQIASNGSSIFDSANLADGETAALQPSRPHEQPTARQRRRPGRRHVKRRARQAAWPIANMYKARQQRRARARRPR